MGFVVYLGQMLEVKVRIDLGRRDIGMAQELLHAPQVMTRLQEVRGEGVPEQVRIDATVDALVPRPSTPTSRCFSSGRPRACIPTAVRPSLPNSAGQWWTSE